MTSLHAWSVSQSFLMRTPRLSLEYRCAICQHKWCWKDFVLTLDLSLKLRLETVTASSWEPVSRCVCQSLTDRQTDRQAAVNHTTQRDAAGPVMLITRDPRPKNPIGFRRSTGGIWCEEVIRMPLRQRDT